MYDCFENMCADKGFFQRSGYYDAQNNEGLLFETMGATKQKLVDAGERKILEKGGWKVVKSVKIFNKTMYLMVQPVVVPKPVIPQSKPVTKLIDASKKNVLEKHGWKVVDTKKIFNKTMYVMVQPTVIQKIREVVPRPINFVPKVPQTLELKRQIIALENTNANLVAKNQSLVAEKDRILNDCQTSIDEASAILKQLTDEKNNLLDVVAQNNNTLQEQESALKERQVAIEQLNNNIAELETFITSQKSNIREIQEDYSQCQVSLEEEEKRILPKPISDYWKQLTTGEIEYGAVDNYQQGKYFEMTHE